MAYETILYAAADGLAVITLNRPEKFNAFTRKLHTELQDALRAAEKDSAVRCLVITGAGKAFCAGQDLTDLGGGPIGEVVRRYYNPLIARLRNLEKPVIAAINGVAAGAGLSLALACDLRVAAATATFTTAFVKIGLVPDSAASYFLPRLVGPARAAELFLLGERIGAAEAERMGLVNKVVPEAEFAAAWQGWAQKLAAGPLAQGLIKRLLNRSLTSSLEQQMELEAWFQELAGASADAGEGIAAFVEKRPARFRGQ